VIPEYAKEMQVCDMPDNAARELAEIFGVELTLSLLEAAGGASVYFPSADKLPEGGKKADVKIEELPTGFTRELAEDFGAECAVELCRYFDGSTVYLPKLGNTISEYRNKKLVEEYFRGKSARELSRKYGVTQSYVLRLIKASDKGGLSK